MVANLGSVPVAEVHRWKTEATQRLLGSTIGFTEDQWHQAAGVPGWTRAHVATHLARNADYLRAVLVAAQAGLSQPELPTQRERRSELELGADRPGLELQIDLDASCGALQSAIEATTDWTPTVRINGADLPLSAVPLVRLHEVCVHHLDLACGVSADDLAADAAQWLLRWVLFRLEDADIPRLKVVGDSTQAVVGTGPGQPHEVHAHDARLWAWLSGRAAPASVNGAENLRLPLLS